jgi:flavin reductase (DIM6/NTAB) family NADH-FMN oxidoreductase RutF
MDVNPDRLEARHRYRLMIGSIVPRPIAFVSTVSVDGRPNLAPFSFFSGVGAEPMTVAFCPANRPDGSEKDTLRNCKPVAEGGTGEFVVNVAIEAYRREVSAAGEPLPHGESEFDLTGLETAPSVVVRAPRVAASPVAYECRTFQVTRLAPDVPGGANLVIGEVVRIYIEDRLVNDRFEIDADRLSAIGRMGGIEYCRTADRFAMPRGRAALQDEEGGE